MTTTTRERPLRILHIVEAAGAGVGRHVVDLAGGCATLGDIVDIAYGSQRAEPDFQVGLAATPVRYATQIAMGRRPTIGDAAIQRALRRLVAEHGPYDVIHGHASKGGLHARLLPRTGVSVYTPNAFITQSPDLGKVQRWMYGHAERLLARRTSGLITVSPEEAAHAVKLGLRPRHSRIIPNGLSPCALPSREQARNELDVPADGVVVGFVGRLSSQKGADLLLDAIAQLPERVDATWAIVGDGEDAQRLRSQAAALGLGDRVRWCGQRPGRRMMPAFDLLVLPSRYEGFPYVALEALAAGVPVIASASSSTSLLLGDGRCGQIAGTTPAELAHAIGSALDRPMLLLAWSQAARLRASDFTAEAMVTSTRSFYLELIDASGRGS